MSNIDAFANSLPPEMPGIPHRDDVADGTFPTDTGRQDTEVDAESDRSDAGAGEERIDTDADPLDRPEDLEGGAR